MRLGRYCVKDHHTLCIVPQLSALPGHQSHEDLGQLVSKYKVLVRFAAQLMYAAWNRLGEQARFTTFTSTSNPPERRDPDDTVPQSRDSFPTTSLCS